MNFPIGQPPCFIQLGRFGDIILLLPAFKLIFDRIGLKPRVIVSTQYKSVLNGISYVEPIPVDFDWWQGIPKARELAEQMYGGAIVPQWWNDPDRAPLADLAYKGGIVLQCHGREWGIDINKWPNFMASMWDRAGFSVDEMRITPLIFDRRDPDRERRLFEFYNGRNKKPILLVNFTGHSSPFGPVPEVMRQLDSFRSQIHVIDLGKVHGEKIYDLLGFYDRAIGMITTDTATLHLAAASSIPYIGYTVNGWCSSTPKGNVQLEIKYGDALNRLGEVSPMVQSWINHAHLPLLHSVSAEGPGVPAAA
jgi:hypothetical protein